MTFAAALAQACPEATAADVAEVERAIAAARTRWPDGPVPDDELARYLGERWTGPTHAGDLYLAWWCASGAPAALATFEAEFAGELALATARFRSLPADELRQHLRLKLFFPVGASPARIRAYAGLGPLRGWLRVMALRTFVDVTRGGRRDAASRALEDTDLVTDPRTGLVGADLTALLKQALAAAVTGLEPRQRVFLRHVYVEELTLEQIAALYGIHRATVARTLATARAQVTEATRGALAARLGDRPDDLSTVVRALERDVDLSLSRILDAPPP
jgi:RNA polymerase sigma-70 factor (ECF subfamily)